MFIAIWFLIGYFSIIGIIAINHKGIYSKDLLIAILFSCTGLLAIFILIGVCIAELPKGPKIL